MVKAIIDSMLQIMFLRSDWRLRKKSEGEGEQTSYYGSPGGGVGVIIPASLNTQNRYFSI